jgi:LPXTG-site transpeptidase (sortase) family protein
MRNLSTCALTLLLATVFLIPSPLALGRAPLVPVAEAAAKQTAPVRLSIPAITLDDAVVPMGVLANGDLDVPSGTTQDVGWYARGVVPGERGSAVMDAHVFAAFSNLNQVQKGDDLYVGMADGTTRHFVVTKTRTYKLADLSPQELFEDHSGRYLRLITCAGQLTPDHSTYTHRLVVYATLVK